MIKIVNESFNASEKSSEFLTQLLGRMVSDCDYYLGNGMRHPKHLWADNEKEQIEYMKEIWKELNSRGVNLRRLTYDDILDYEEKMIEQ